MVPIVEREQLAWAAGLFEGEGTFSRSQKVPIAQLSSTDADVVEHFAEVMGFGSLYHFTRRDPWKNGMTWATTTFEQMQATVAALWPWLGERRRARATELLLAYRERLAARTRGDGTLAGELFGRRSRDLTPVEYTEYRRVQAARNRADRVNRTHGLTGPNPHPA